MPQPPVLYQETRLTPSSATSSQILQINAGTQPSPSFNVGRKRGFDEISGLDEEGYARKHLATEGAVFFRLKERTPRSFLWRVLDDRKVLEIQAVDIVHHKQSNSESWLTFRTTLPSAIVKNGVALADSVEHDALEAFVLTSGNELYTITLKRDLLVRETAPTDFDAKTCYRRYASNSLAFRQLYKFVAVSSLELLISLHDGGLMRLERQANESGSQWRETFFSEGGWSGTLRGLIPLKRHQTVPYGDMELEPNAIAAMSKSPNGKYIWTVSLDHELKAWNASTGKKVVSRDLLGDRQEDDGKKQQKFLMAGEQGTLLQVAALPVDPKQKSIITMGEEDNKYVLVLHSPKDHQFKFYAVLETYSDGAETIEFEDLRPSGDPMIPPVDDMLNTNIWHLEEFYIQPDAEWRDTRIWLRARSGAHCRIFTNTFDLFFAERGEKDEEDRWQSGWSVVETGMQTVEALRARLDFPGDLEDAADPSTPTERWLEFVFKPGRFTIASIETALNIYRKGRGLIASGGAGRGLNTTQQPLKERIVQAITSKIIVRRLPNERPDYNGYQMDVQAQWKIFFSLLSHLHGRRNDSIAFACDFDEGLPWSVCADFVAPIRANSEFENIYSNQHMAAVDMKESTHDDYIHEIFPVDHDKEIDNYSPAVLLKAVSEFCGRLSPDFRNKFRDRVISDAIPFEGGDRDAYSYRVQALYDDLSINSEVMDDDFQALEAAAEHHLGGLGNLTEYSFLAVAELTTEELQTHKRNDVSLNRFGDKFLIALARETLSRNQEVLLNLLTLAVFMYGDLDQDELHEDFLGHIGSLYEALITRIKHNEMLSWLAWHEIPEPTSRHRGSKSDATDVAVVPLLERVAIGDWDPRSRGSETMPELLTTWGMRWIYGSDLFRKWDGTTCFVLGVLIKGQFYDLAADFDKFIVQGENSSAWSNYLEGRLCIATGEYTMASAKFTAAAPDMAQIGNVASADMAFLLSDEEKLYFGQGLSRFYQHVASLFEKIKMYSYTADFARLAIDNLENDPHFENSMSELDRRRALPDSPAATRADDRRAESVLLQEYSQRRDELGSRLFNALVQTGRFAESFEALCGMLDMPMKKSDLKTLIETCVRQDAVKEMLRLPFEEGKLGAEADALLLALAKKGLASASAAAPPYYRFLYAFRTQRGDYRGAAEILYEYLERLRISDRRHGMQDPEDETLMEAYVLLINTLACCGEDEAWLLADPIEEVHGDGKKRRLVRLADVRREYGVELDRRSDLLQGRFPLVGFGEEMDVF